MSLLPEDLLPPASTTVEADAGVGVPQAGAPPTVPGPGLTTAGTEEVPTNPRKRALDDKKEREKKRAQRNRELARMSNERRKNRIKAMESELEETKKTVTSLEESIRQLEEENNGLKTLLDGKQVAAGGGAAPFRLPQ